jgi:molecular chaperone GrpE
MAIDEQEFEASASDAQEQSEDSNLDSLEDSEPTELERALAELDAANAEKADLMDRLRRSQAEFENARKRLQREQEDTREYAAMSTIEALLPVVDDFDRALETEAVDPEFLKGLELIRDRIVEVFQRAGLEPVAAEGEFDPHHHMAVDRAAAETDEQDQQILEVYRKGYRFKERLLRPAMVKVAVKE